MCEVQNCNFFLTSQLLSAPQLLSHCLAFVLAELRGSPDEHFEGAHCWHGEGEPDLPSV